MATSGSTDFTLNARDVIDFALKKLGVLAINQTATSAQAQAASRELNMMLKGWQKYENLWRYREDVVPLTANTTSYTLTLQKSFRVVSAHYRNSSDIDLEMILLTREEYFNLPVKTSPGIPTQYYVDYQLDVPVLYVWPVIGSVTTETIHLTSLRRFEDVDNLSNDLDVKTEFLEVVGYNLAKRLGTDYGRNSSTRFVEIKEMAERLLQEALDEDREDEVRFVPGYGW